MLLLLIEPNCHDSHEQSSSDFWLHACAVCLAPAMKCAFVLRVCVDNAWRVSDDHERCLVRFLVLLWFAHPIITRILGVDPNPNQEPTPSTGTPKKFI